jgi:hypothetical protein
MCYGLPGGYIYNIRIDDIYEYIHLHTYIYIHIYIHTYILTYICVCVCVCDTYVQTLSKCNFRPAQSQTLKINLNTIIFKLNIPLCSHKS